MTNSIDEIDVTDCMLLTGTNTTENHPVLSSYVKRAVKFKGTKLIVIDPRKIKISEFADKWLRPNPGTDVAWINGLIHVILKVTRMEIPSLMPTKPPTVAILLIHVILTRMLQLVVK